MRSNVLQFFANLPASPEEQFNKAFELFRKSPGKNPSSERFLNTSGYTKVNLENLFYDLKNLHNISEAQIRASIVVKKPVLVIAFEDIKNKTTEELVAFLLQENVELPEFNIPTDYNELKAYVKENNIEAASLKKEDLNTAIINDFEATIVRIAIDYLEPTPEDVVEEITITATTPEEVFIEAPSEVKETIKLRDEFPFLNDPDCPEELFILVGKKFAHYDAYVKAHAALLMVVESEENPEAQKVQMTPEQITALALTAVVNFELNQDIYKELEFYKENGKILGEHPIFLERKLKAGIDTMTIAEATKKMSNLDNYIRRSGKALENAKTEEEKEKLTKKLQSWQTELILVKAKLGFSDKE